MNLRPNISLVAKISQSNNHNFLHEGTGVKQHENKYQREINVNKSLTHEPL